MNLLDALTDAALLTSKDRQGNQSQRTQLQAALRQIREVVTEVVPGHATKHGEGQVIPSDIPWVCIFPADEPNPDPKRGFYVVYLVSEDGSHMNLCLGVGTVASGPSGAMKARSLALRSSVTAPVGSVSEPVLDSSGTRAASYAAGTAFAVAYDIDAMPANEKLEADLTTFVNLMDEAYGNGLRFSESPEPLHLFYPWLEELHGGVGIVATRKNLADRLGAAWWVTNTPFGDESVSLFNGQVAAGTPTYAFLYSAGDSWRARVLRVTKSVAEVEAEPELLAESHSANEGRLAMKLCQFEPMPQGWRGEGLLGKGGLPTEESVAARPAFTYVYSGRPDEHIQPLEPTVPVMDDETIAVSVQAAEQDVDAQLTQLALNSGLEKSFLRELHDVLRSDMPQVVLAGPPGTGKTWLAKKLSDIGHAAPGPSYSLVQFHPSYAYEDFIEGLRPTVRDKQVVFENEDGHLLRLVHELANGGPSTLIIDELNRANIPSVFGELLYLLEYRNESASLRLSGEFRLPPEVRFIATMNTADRSIRSMDAALRRRFEVFELSPSGDVLRNYYKAHGTNEVPDLVDGFELLNERLTNAIDRHHGIGHSFFMRKVMTPASLRAAWLRKVRPLVEEYFFDEPHRVEAEFAFGDLWSSQGP